MTDDQKAAKQEFDAIAAVHGALEPLEPEARVRVLTYIASLLGIASHISVKGPALGVDSADDDEEEEENKSDDGDGAGSRAFGTFAELFDAANPHTQNDMALVASYWLQVSKVADSFTAQAASIELANLGHKLPNITKNLTYLKALKPAFVLQLKKSGTSQQARKTYKVSVAGVRRVEEMING
jgi:hypothetical protein